MQKTTVYLDEAELAKLKALALQENVRPAVLIRRAIAALVAQESSALPKGTGQYHSGDGRGSTDRKAILRNAARRGRW